MTLLLASSRASVALRDRVKREQREAMLTARELLPRAHAAGISISEISRLASMSRPTVREYLPVDPRRERTRRLMGADS